MVWKSMLKARVTFQDFIPQCMQLDKFPMGLAYFHSVENNDPVRWHKVVWGSHHGLRFLLFCG